MWSTSLEKKRPPKEKEDVNGGDLPQIKAVFSALAVLLPSSKSVKGRKLDACETLNSESQRRKRRPQSIYNERRYHREWESSRWLLLKKLKSSPWMDVIHIWKFDGYARYPQTVNAGQRLQTNMINNGNARRCLSEKNLIGWNHRAYVRDQWLSHTFPVFAPC